MCVWPRSRFTHFTALHFLFLCKLDIASDWLMFALTPPQMRDVHGGFRRVLRLRSQREESSWRLDGPVWNGSTARYWKRQATAWIWMSDDEVTQASKARNYLPSAENPPPQFQPIRLVSRRLINWGRSSLKCMLGRMETWTKRASTTERSEERSGAEKMHSESLEGSEPSRQNAARAAGYLTTTGVEQMCTGININTYAHEGSLKVYSTAENTSWVKCHILQTAVRRDAPTKHNLTVKNTFTSSRDAEALPVHRLLMWLHPSERVHRQYEEQRNHYQRRTHSGMSTMMRSKALLREETVDRGDAPVRCVRSLR